MRFIRPIALVSVFAFAGSAAWAAEPDEHQAHHPATASAPAKAAPAAPGTAMTAAPMPGMDARMKAMQAMHEKMMVAKTPEERQALMAEHTKAMQDGMAMMGSMGGAAGKDGMQCNMPAGAGTCPQMQTLEKRMEIMETMMQIMMARMPPAPAR